MSADDVKAFTIRHVFENVKKMKVGEEMNGPIEYHYNIPWRIRIIKDTFVTFLYLDCTLKSKITDWSIDTQTTGKLSNKFGDQISIGKKFATNDTSGQIRCVLRTSMDEYLIDEHFTIELTVRINEMTGNLEEPKKKLRNFDDDKAKKFSDVVLTIGNQHFHVHKAYLATHCTYFDTLFFGNFAESKKSEIELNDIDPEDFQYFLEFLYAESSIEAETVLGILHLADFFDSKTVIRRSQEFLIYKSELSLKQKFEAAIKYNLEELKTKCISEIETPDDLESLAPKKGVQYGEAVMTELFKKAMSLIQK